MFDRRTILYIFSLLFIAVVHGGETYRKTKRGSNDFDVLIFTQHWPQTVCFTWKESSESHACSMPKERNEWTIHGIWPSQYHKVGPQFCNKSMPFDRDVLKPLESELQEKWIDIEYGRTSYSLWEHEWKKHGTCAAVLQELSNEFNYFHEGLNLLSVYDMKNVLAKANILPGNTYETATILNGIDHVLGKRGLVICRKSKTTGQSYLFEIRICFNKMLELTDCDGVYQYPSNCDTTQGVTYPGEVPHQYQAVQVQ